ncbi:hypothetical protein VOLCADRAFT_86685 [Volvox carteri f. nagariensis]|uniref:Uncharacterized protein n=1 Tax=Volvox carteri f. nagariensis TaxID=3068 RepID=D8TJB8_VOLCA|nr:uncharacterized protein VOLCADRAFT_86685 [Volvox carteri f. nagariensis]EFJ52514.1 hypothetical protein VOLCADRAFT_86685 [Volvox carteri f. nagariensis]|eukprot:XP_002946587.1 hypothetical protein VOLCADRAFT_86685 [Volvox carteri f. nagariensis]
MDSAGTSSYGRAAEALSRTFSNNPEIFNVSLRSMPSLQPRSPPVYSPDTRVFDTPEQSSHLPTRDEGLFTLHRGTTRPEPEHAFHEQMDQYSREQLAKEWDALFLGDGSDDVHNGADVYRQLRKDLRTLSCSLKQSFELLLESRRYSLPGTGPSSGVQQVQACISELKSVAKEMASATRMANDNYNLQVELTLQKHASQHLLSQLHEAQLARMAMEEELNVLRNKAQQAAATEATVVHLRQLNDALQAESQQASGELQELRRRLREQEEKLEATTLQAEHLAERLREIELFEDLGGSHVLFRDLCGSSDGGASESGGVGAGTGAGAADHGSCGRSMAAAAAATAAGNGGPTGESCSVDGSYHGPGGRSQEHARDLPPELRRVLGKLLRRRDSDAAKLREENTHLAEEVARLRELLAAAMASAAAAAVPPPAPEGRRPAAPSTASGPTRPSSASTQGQQQPMQSQQEPRPATPWRSSSDSWHTDDDFDWATRPVTRLADLHPHTPPCPQNGGESPQQQAQRQQHLPHGPRQAQHRPSRPHSRQQHQKPVCQSREAAAEQHDPQQEAASVELEAAKEAIARLTAELAEAQERLRVQQVEVVTAAEAAAAALQQCQEEVRTAEAQVAQGAAALAEVEQAGLQLRGKLQAAQAALVETETSRTKMRTAMEAARKGRGEAQAVVAAQDKFLCVLLIVLQQAVAGRDTLTVELLEARHLAEAKAAVDATNAHAASSDAARLVSENDRMAAELAEAGQNIASLESQLAAMTTANAELQGRLGDMEQRERKAREGLTKDLETARQRIARLQSDLREYRSEAQVARGEATAASRDVKAANSEKLKAQREMEDAVERLRQVESERDTLAAALAAAVVLPDAEAQAETNATARGTVGEQEPATAADVEEEMLSELEAGRRELAAAGQLLSQEGGVSEQEAERLGAQLKALHSELEAVKTELAEAEARLAQSESKAAAAQEHHVSETLRLQSSLAEAQQRVTELEEQLAILQRAAEKDVAAAATVGATSTEARLQDLSKAEARLRQLEEQLQAAEAAQRLAEKRYDEELNELRAQLVGSAAAVATAKPFHGCSTSSSDAGTSGGASPERLKEAAAAGAIALQSPADGSPQEPAMAEDDDDDDELEDLLMLRARCRVLRGELASARSRLAALIKVSEAAAQSRLAEAVAEAQAAAAAGRVKSDEEFWAHNEEVHSLHALVTALRATCLYAGAAGAHASYGDTRADGAGSVVAASTSQLASSRRRQLLLQYRDRCGQLAELLSEAEALTRLPTPPPSTQYQQQYQHQLLQVDGLDMRSAGRGQSSSSSHRGSDDGHHLQAQDRRTGYRQCGNGSGIAAIAGGGAGTTGSSLPEAPARAASRAPAGVTGVEAWEDSSPPLLRLGLLSSEGFAVGSGGRVLVEADAAQYGMYEPDPIVVFKTTEADSTGGTTRRSYLSNGTGQGQGHDYGTSAITDTVIPPPPPAPMPSSSFTSDTGSSLADDDLTSLSHLYEIPPMASPPKFDLSDLDFGNLAL